MSHDDFDFEPQRGLPGVLPVGESLLWQGTPNWRGLAIRSYHLRKIAVYFALLAAWRAGSGIVNGQSAAAVCVGVGFIVILGIAAVAILAALAYFNARSAVYSITTRRVLVRQGIAVPLTLNLPLRYIDSAGVRLSRNGTGDIVMTLARSQRIAFLINWPHLNPGRYSHPQPSFRALTDVQAAARILGEALAAESAAASVGTLAGGIGDRMERPECVDNVGRARSSSPAAHPAAA